MKATQNVQSVSMQVLEALIKPKLTYNDRAKIIAEGFAQIEKNQFNFNHLATKSDLKETELKLTSDNKNLELKLTKEIEVVRKETEAIRLETKNLEVKLIREINNQKVEITREISQSSKNTIKWTTGLIITMMIAIASLVLMK